MFMFFSRRNYAIFITKSFSSNAQLLKAFKNASEGDCQILESVWSSPYSSTVPEPRHGSRTIMMMTMMTSCQVFHFPSPFVAYTSLK